LSILRSEGTAYGPKIMMKVRKNVAPWPPGAWCADQKRKEDLAFLTSKFRMKDSYLNIFINSITSVILPGCTYYGILIILVKFHILWILLDRSSGKMYTN
jgi:hypothetical protein